MNTTQPQPGLWPFWKKILFRFCFIYLLLQIAPWTWLEKIPGGSVLTTPFRAIMDIAVNAANANIFHIKTVLVPPNGSGDTSYAWAQLFMIILIAVIGCIVWSITDRKKNNYTHLNYWLCLFARYYIAIAAFSYGIIKIFGFQMHTPHLYELATQMGDFFPMPLFWNVIGYSTPYQAFSGYMEVIVGVLLLFRRTSTLGIIVGTAVFINVMVLNFCYDIPVKIFSMQLVFTCLFLLANESNRIICFFILNKPADTCSIYQFNYSKKWIKITRMIVKGVFILVVIIIPFFSCLWSVMESSVAHVPDNIRGIKYGLYDIVEYNRNKQPVLATDTTRWEDFILDNGIGSIKTRDKLFHSTYNRTYFGYTIDSARHNLVFTQNDNPVLIMKYALIDSNTIKLWGKKGADSLFMVMKRSNHHFQLAQKQFHWLTEHNR